LRRQGGDVDLYSLGEALLLEHRFDAMPATEVSKQFGDKFVANLAHVPIGQWFGPIESGYGMHLVFVEERSDRRLPDLAEIRDAVRRKWTNVHRLESNEKFFQNLLKRYQVVVEKIDPAKAEQKLADAK
jgi:parvulin-like peptidyl-prolyl isomerase